ncbi:hypothetical protein SAMN05216330_101128 [Bradyrhizobium sp. Ghvi]|uniref:hypothetical protein n=1 Tax=Bradyrhizobium sp. Ghvi TaxID=1855319 RepID=UPI0008EF45DD|nr:hypothetical protein [Bradyrhizobium sp. Ghvi]SFN64778.1 hypothetical protein SAMN05216330_101128 [Bradyrhizobium sp. Ghvi]
MTFEKHSQHPDISIDRHVKARVVELGQTLAGKNSIYLDVRYWLFLRQAQLANDDSSPKGKLLLSLREAVKGGKVFCPISESVFLELLKQSDPESRLRTAKLIDELSLGVSLLSQRERVATELAHFLFLGQKGADVYPLRHLVWTKLPYVLGFLHPTEIAIDAANLLAIQKAFFDKMWTINLVEMMEMFGPGPLPLDPKLDAIAAKLNAGNVEHAVKIKSFQQALTDELSGVADFCADTAADIMGEIAVRQGYSAPSPNSDEWKRTRQMYANLVFHGLQAKPSLRQKLPTLYIEACLHAATRWDKTRRVAGNDIYDFNHASAAVAHCQAFFLRKVH